MKVYLHVGMGKTGTTSIQAALRESASELALKQAALVEALVPNVEDKKTYLNILRKADPIEQAEYAASFASKLETLSEKQDIKSVIVSNEGLYGSVAKIEPFLEALNSHLDVQVLAFIRHPSDWLPSAYAQWGISHKRNPGKVPSFEVETRRLLRLYNSIDGWHRVFKDRVMLLPYEPGGDTVSVFGQAIGIDLQKANKRHLARSEDSELLMRALFNDQEREAALPAKFNRVVVNTRRKPIPKRQHYYENHFDRSSLDALIEEKKSIFQSYKDKYNFDVLALKTKESPEPINEAEVDSRLLDYLLQLNLTHARRLHKLEKAVSDYHEKAEKDAIQSVNDEMVTEIQSLRKEVLDLKARINGTEKSVSNVSAPDVVNSSDSQD